MKYLIMLMYLIMLIMLYSNFTSCIAGELSNTKSTQSSENTHIETQKQEIIKYFDDYMQHYNDYLSDNTDMEATYAMAANYHLPTFQIIPGIPLRAVKSADDLAKGSQRFLDSLRTQGVTHIKWEKVQIEILTANTVFASNVGAPQTIFRIDGL